MVLGTDAHACWPAAPTPGPPGLPGPGSADQLCALLGRRWRRAGGSPTLRVPLQTARSSRSDKGASFCRWFSVAFWWRNPLSHEICVTNWNRSAAELSRVPLCSHRNQRSEIGNVYCKWTLINKNKGWNPLQTLFNKTVQNSNMRYWLFKKQTRYFCVQYSASDLSTNQHYKEQIAIPSQ